MIDLLERSLPLLFMGLAMTVKVVMVAASISFSFGLLFGVLTCEVLKVRYLSSVIQFVTFILRAVPFYVQLLIVYFIFPDLIGVNLDVFGASVISLGMCSAGYVCQIVRCGINSIPMEQWEAPFVLGYGRMRALFFIILPQMFRNVLPAFNNELESMLKSTAILSAIGMLELTRVGMNIVSREMGNPMGIYLIVALFYVGLSTGLNWIARFLEKRMWVRG